MKLKNRIKKYEKWFESDKWKVKPFKNKPRNSTNQVWRKLNEKIEQSAKKIKEKEIDK